MVYHCSVCLEKVNGDMIVYLDHTNNHIIDLVKHDHPEWVEKDGICQKCLEYYNQELHGGAFQDAACAIRRRKIKGVMAFFQNLFKGGKS